MRLAELQAAFHALATGADRGGTAADELLVGTAELGAAERIAIYADMYRVRQSDALREAFPATAAVVGERAFSALVAAYVRAHPSEDPDLSRLGRHLAAFLRGHPEHAPRADVPELAALEWARNEVFFEASRGAIGRDALAALDPDLFADARLRFVPALRLLRFERDPLPLWRAVEHGAPPAACAGPGAAAVWRPELDAVHGALPADEAEALARAMTGAAVSEICEAFAAAAAPVEAAFAAIASWVDEGWVAGVDAPSA